MEVNIYPRIKEFEHLLELYPPIKANKFLPEWYKNQKFNNYIDSINAKNNEIQSAKNCPAIQDEMTSGFIIPSWSDVYIYRNNEGFISWDVRIGGSFPDELEWVGNQTDEQIKGMGLKAIPNFGVLKLVSPYFYQASEGYGLRFSDPFYHHRRNIRFLPAMVEADIWHGTNFPFEFFVDVDDLDDKKCMIKAGDPLLMVTPYKKENKFDLKINKWDEDFDKKQSDNLKLLHSVSESFTRYKKTKNNL